MDTIGAWHIGHFHHDPSDDSHFWIETRDGADERLAHTGPHREALYIAGSLILPAHILHLPAEPDRARERYIQLGEWLTSLIHEQHDRQADN